MNHTRIRARLRRACTTALALLALGLSPASVHAVDPVPALPGTWQLQFQDEFSGSSLDGAKWRLGTHYAGIAGSGQLAPSNVSVSGGSLRLKAEQESASFGGVTRSYSCGEVSTYFNYRQQYGYMEARVKYPAVTGLWPAFWLMPDRATYGSRDAYRRAYLRFNLAGSGVSTVSSAVLRLKVSSLQTAGVNSFVTMRLADDAWGESTINWNNKPTPDPVWISQKWNPASAVGNEIDVDVTAYVAQELAGDGKASLVLADTYMRAQLLQFHSKEATVAGNRPRLIINGSTTLYPEADATVRWGAYSATNYGSDAALAVKDDWGNTADTFNGGMEIDAMESLGIWGADEIQHALHWDGYGTSHKSAEWPGINFPATGDGFHTYGVYWEPGLVAFYVDGVKTGERADSRVMSVPAFMILSLQLGGWGNNNVGAQVDGQVMEVDWVRAWSGTRAAPTTVTVDNTDSASVAVSSGWTSYNTVPGYIGADYLLDGNAGKGTKTVTYVPALTADGNYLVYGRWTSDPNRAANVPIDIDEYDGITATATVNQQAGGGQWNLLGAYDLAVVNAALTVRTDGTSGQVVADAFRFVPTPSAGAVTVDNLDTASVVVTGTWTASSATAGYQGTNYHHDGNTAKGTKSFSFKPAVAATGPHLVYVRWTSDANRASNVPVDVVQSGGATATTTINQRTGGGQWNLIGVYDLSPTNAEVKLRTTGTNGYVIADAVKVVPVAAQ